MSKINFRIISAVIEAMESRRLLTSTLSAGVLTIVGTAGNDVTTLSVSGTNIKVLEGATSHLFPTASVSKIVADMKAGNDKLTIATAITKPASLQGGIGNDTIVSGSGNDTIRGGDGNDSLSGNIGNDLMDGNNGIDTLNGNAGNDSFLSGLGNDVIDGGLNTDTVDYSARSTPVSLYLSLNSTHPGNVYGTGGEGAEHDSLNSIETGIGGNSNDLMGFTNSADTAATASVRLLGGPGNDTVQVRSSFTDTQSSVSILGGAGNDVVTLTSFDKTYIYGEDGNDTITVGSGASDEPYGYDPLIASGGNGTDNYSLSHADWTSNSSKLIAYTLDSTTENFNFTVDTLIALKVTATGNALNNNIVVNYPYGATILGLAGNDTITGAGGVDSIRGGDGNDSIVGGIGDDILKGDTGNDTIKGSDGNDVIQGGVGDDSLLGEAGDDGMTGNAGTVATNDADTMDGGAGDDYLSANYAGRNTIFGGIGNDVINGSTFDDIATHQIIADGGDGNDMIYGTKRADSITCGAGNDTVFANAGNDSIYGGKGIDSLSGENGNDLIYGSTGNDTITGGAGKDTLIGEDGNDTFFAKDGEADTIYGDGGATLIIGKDTATVDKVDVLFSIETIL